MQRITKDRSVVRPHSILILAKIPGTQTTIRECLGAVSPPSPKAERASIHCSLSIHWPSLSIICLLVSSAFTSATDYKSEVLADSPSAYWRMGESSGTTAVDIVGGHNGTLTQMVLGEAGAITNDTDTAFGFSGSSYAIVPFSADLNTPAFSIECWANTKSLRGQRIITSRAHLFGGTH